MAKTLSTKAKTPRFSRREREIMDVIYRLGQATAVEVRTSMAAPPSYSSVRSSTDLDAAAQQTEQSYAWQDKVRESMTSGKGLKDAFAWRDGPYKEKLR